MKPTTRSIHNATMQAVFARPASDSAQARHARRPDALHVEPSGPHEHCETCCALVPVERGPVSDRGRPSAGHGARTYYRVVRWICGHRARFETLTHAEVTR